jgi:aminoglycoside 3-N-acetyltransferase I
MNAPALQIRRLTAADVSLMRALNGVFADAFDDVESYRRTPPDDAYLERILGKDHVIALVALKDTVVVAGLVAYELHKLEQARSEVYLYDLAVAGPHRRQGAASELIRQLRAIAHQRGAWVAFVQADHGDDPAIALYSRLGVREDVLHFDLPVP